MPRRRLAAPVLAAFCAALTFLGRQAAGADALPRLAPDAAYAEIAHSGELRRVQIDGDLDVGRMRPPSGATRILMQNVKLEGTLRSSTPGPPVPLRVDNSDLRNVDLHDTRWSAALQIENSRIGERAWFDGAQFDGPVTLHGSTFMGQASFRSVRFGGPVEITSSTFSRPPPLRAAVSFTDARFAGPARFDRSSFEGDLRFDTSRFQEDATFLGLVVSGRASWRNVIFNGDAEFRFCRLGEADFGDAEQMSVFMRLADFRGCAMRSLRLDYVDGRGDMLLTNVLVAPGDLTLRQASLRGSRTDFSGLDVAGKLDLEGAQIPNLQLRWSQIRNPLLRSEPASDVLIAVQQRLEELKREDDAREASVVLRHTLIAEALARPETPWGDKVLLRFERAVWGGATGYGTRLERAVGIALACWVLLTLPLIIAPRIRVAPLRAVADDAPPLHRAVPREALQPAPASPASRGLRLLSYTFALMFALPKVRLRPAQPLSGPVQGYLLFLRGVGLGLLALMALTLAKVSPVIQAVLGKIVG